MKKILGRFLILSSFVTLVGGLAVFLVITYFSLSLPKIANLADYRPPIKSQILSKDGVVLAEIGLEDRDIVEFKDIPKSITNAFLSAEDSGFYEHTGVDYLGVMRAMIANLKAGRVVQGGSTITQQVAKSLLLSRERSITRKIKDFLLAQKIEKRFSKEEILFLYLNQVYLGGGYYGVKAAFRGYFEKDLSEATVAESALVAGLLVAPGKYSPYVNPIYAKKRQAYVLGRMYANEKITKEEYENALKEKIKYRLRKPAPFKAGYFTEHVRQVVVEMVGNDEFLQNGFKVSTTLDYELQDRAEREITEGARDIDRRQGFKGPIRKVDVQTFEESFEKFRKDLYENKSLYFTLGDDNQREYEISYAEGEATKVIEAQKEVRAKFYSSRYHPGYIEDDQLLSNLDKTSLYEAIVIGTDDSARVIYVTVGGVTGIIPYPEFRWAHERIIQEEHQYFPYVTKPSSILNRGDVVLVKINKMKTTLLDETWSSFKDNIQKAKDYKTVSTQSYLQCSLEQEPEVQAALLSVNPHNGEIVSLVGGTNFEKSKFNRALQSKRQPGSSFKPMLFAAGLENGYTPSTLILDTPEALGGNDESLNWKPRNYDGGFKGPMTFRESLEHSRNIPTIKMTLDLGMTKVFDFLNRIGFEAEMPKDLSIALGSFGVTLLEMVESYSLFPNGGKKISPKFITSIIDRDGKEYIYELNKETTEESEATPDSNQKNSLVDNKNDSTEEIPNELQEEKNPYQEHLDEQQLYDSRLSYIMTNLLKGVVQNGTGRGGKWVSNFIGGKTGTTNSYVDAWFLGFSQNIVTGVWTGFDDNKTMGWGETGSKSALPIWAAYMKDSIRKYGESDFKVPLGIINVYVDKKTGKAINDERNGFLESFVEGTEPGAKQENNFFKKQQSAGSSTEIFEDDEYFNNQ